MINVKLIKKIDLKGYIFLEGFPGAGLVGPMALSYIIDKIDMQLIGYIESDDFPPIVAVHDEKPMPAVRIYANEKYKIVTVLAEFAIPIEQTVEFSNTLYSFIKENKLSRIISVGGMPSSQQNIDNETIFVIVSSDALKKEVQKAGLKPISEGIATGIGAVLMLKSTMDNTSDINILIPIDPNILDPKYAELAIKSLNKLINLNIDVTELDKEAKEVEAKVRELLKKSRETQDAHKRAIDQTGPSMYA
ncbi:MAG: proteasome assembly chaperone family protein [Candidatus Micrarchaeia archaeon]